MREIKLSDKEINYALFGLVLGDGTLKFHSFNSKSCRVQCVHTNKQREYVILLENLFKNLACKVSSRYDYEQKSNFGDYVCSCVSIKPPDYRHFIKFNRFIVINEENKRKKIVSNYVLRRINPLGLMLWFLDDGNLATGLYENYDRKNKSFSFHRRATLATLGFSYFENIKIKEMFKKRFDIEVTIQKKSKYHQIYFSRKAFEKLLLLIKDFLPLVPPSMLYKFDLKYEDDNSLSLKNLIESAEQAVITA